MAAITYDAIFGALTIRQVRGTDVSQNVETLVDRFSGGLDPQMVGVLSAEPKVMVRTGNLGCLSSISASAGLAVTSPGTIVLPWQARASGSTFQSGGNHYSWSSTLGLLLPQSISAQQDSKDGAVLTLEFTAASSDGLTAPMAFNSGVSLASQSYVRTHGLGPVTVNGTAIGGLKSTNLQFGVPSAIERYQGFPYAGIDGIFVGERLPKLELEFQSEASAAAAGLLGAATTVVCYYRSFAAGSTREANATGAHVALTLSGGLYVLDSSSGQGTQHASHKITVHAHTVSAVSTTATLP